MSLGFFLFWQTQNKSFEFLEKSRNYKTWKGNYNYECVVAPRKLFGWCLMCCYRCQGRRDSLPVKALPEIWWGYNEGEQAIKGNVLSSKAFLFLVVQWFFYLNSYLGDILYNTDMPYKFHIWGFLNQLDMKHLSLVLKGLLHKNQQRKCPRCLHFYAHCYTIYNSQDIEITQRSKNR